MLASFDPLPNKHSRGRGMKLCQRFYLVSTESCGHSVYWISFYFCVLFSLKFIQFEIHFNATL